MHLGRLPAAGPPNPPLPRMTTTSATPAALALQAGRPWPLGASVEDGGVNFALVAPEASAVELCLFDPGGTRQTERLALPGRSGDVWHGRLAPAGPGLVYGFRVHGPWSPVLGERFNPAKVVLDPYAREIVGRYDGSDLFLGHDPAQPSQPDPRDNADVALKARVVADPPPLADTDHVHVPAADTVLLELHVRGATMRHPEVPAELRGSYAGLAHPAFLDHLQRLGITTVSLLPLVQRADEARLLQLGLSNYWGYSSIGWFAPEARFASGRPGHSALQECRAMVDALHARGFEVVVDMVFNHSAETDEWGPTLSHRGTANRLYYHLRPGDSARYENWSGCGNCLNLTQPRVLQMVMDSLRFWVHRIGVDGFRFDLAPILARGADGFNARSAFFAAVAQDPLLSRVKLIAEPWDIGPGGYRLGQFPPGWQEWNDRYRDAMRAFWLGGASRGEFVHALAGSSSVFAPAGRGPLASVNLITAHDGFNLRDLVSYRERHNEANGEHNRDGHSHNHSVNCGVEGDSADPAVLAQRSQLRRALLATLLVSMGTPMLLAGDEIGHSQRGNNNAYCQDNEITWLDWAQADRALAEFVSRCVCLRRRHALLRREHWLRDDDVRWLRPDAQPLASRDWERHDERALAAWLRAGEPAAGEAAAPDLLLLVNPGMAPQAFQLPRRAAGGWRLALASDSHRPPQDLGSDVLLPPHSLWVAESAASAAPTEVTRG